MLDLIFYTRMNQTKTVTVSEKEYKRLAEAGLGRVVTYKEYKLIVEDEEYEVDAAELNFDNRQKFLSIVETERHKELQNVFNSINSDPTIKEIRENLDYVRTLTEMYSLYKDEDNLFFSYE